MALTGGTGALGRHVLRELARRNIEVQALCRPGRDPDETVGVQWIEGTLEDTDALDALVEGTDAILHLAYCPMEEAPPEGRSVAEHFAETNLVGTVRLIERAPRTRLRQILFTSSLAVFGPIPYDHPAAERMPLDEDFPVWPKEFYGGHKAALEKLVRASASVWELNASIWRLGWIIADYDDAHRDPLVKPLQEAREHGAIRDQHGAYIVAANDIARILVDAIGDDSVRGELYHVFDRWFDTNEFAAPLSDLLGTTIKPEAPPAPEPDPALRKPAMDGRGFAFRTDEILRARLADLMARGS